MATSNGKNFSRSSKTPAWNGASSAIGLAERDRSALLAADHYRLMFERSPDATLVASADGTYLDANPAALALLGYRWDDLINLRVEDIVQPGPDWTEEAHARSVRNGRWQNEVEVRIESGARVPMDSRTVVLGGPGGGLQVSVLRDLTERSRSDLTQSRMAALVRSSADAIVGETLDGIITDWNHAAERLYGYSAEEAIGQPLEMLAPPERTHEVYALLARARRGERIEESETVHWTKDSRLIDVSLTIWPVRDDAGQIIAAAATIRNITERKAAEAELAAAHQQTHHLLERLTDGVYALDQEWRFTYVNEAAEGMLGRTREELFGKNLWEELLPLAETPLYAACQEALATETTTDAEFLYPPLNAWLEARVYPSPHGLSLLIRNVNAPRQHEEEPPASEAKFQELVEHLPAVVYLLAADDQQTPLYFSTRLLELTGYRPEEILARTDHWQEGIHPDDRERVAAEVVRTATMGEPFRLEYRFVRKDGDEIWVRDEREATRDESGKVIAWQGMLFDVSERKQVEQELKEALDAAETVNRAKNHFLAMMSHELRTPLQAVLGYADFLLSDQATSLTPEQANDIGSIRKGASRMVTLIDQLLDMSRLEADRLNLIQEPVDLGEIIEQVRQDVAPQAAAKSLAVHVDVPESLPHVLGDRVRLRQVLLNLAANAVKFTEAGSLRITASASDDGVDVAVSDTGIGIPAEALEHIFEEFWQADSDSARRSDGAGLGLAIAKKLAEHMGGRIQVESGLEAGSTFTLHLTTS